MVPPVKVTFVPGFKVTLSVIPGEGFKFILKSVVLTVTPVSVYVIPGLSAHVASALKNFSSSPCKG